MKQIYKELGKVRPTVEGDWSIDKNYTLLSIVYDEVGNASYISRKDVPVGIQITNKEYWTRFSNTRVNSDSIVLLSKIQDDGLINSYDLQEAIDSFKVEDRRLGTFISFYEKPIGESTDYRWNLYQFNSNNIDDWNNTKYWQSIYYIQNKFLGLFSSEESLKRTRPFPIIGDYAFVGATLKEAVVYRCNNIGVWTRTNEKAKDYLSINLKGDITISEEGNWVIDGVDTGISSKGEDGKTPLLRIKDYKWQVSYDGGVIYKDIPNSPIFVKEDGEDIVGDLQTDGVKLLKFADKEYNTSKFSGLGRVYLRKNIVNGKNVLTQEMINKPNTIYIIQYDYDLDNKEINIPENCILNFQGGGLSNGTLNLNNTIINGKINCIKDNISTKGKYIGTIKLSWIGIYADNIDNNNITKKINQFEYKFFELDSDIIFTISNIYIPSNTIIVGNNCTFISNIIENTTTYGLFNIGQNVKLNNINFKNNNLNYEGTIVCIINDNNYNTHTVYFDNVDISSSWNDSKIYKATGISIIVNNKDIENGSAYNTGCRFNNINLSWLKIGVNIECINHNKTIPNAQYSWFNDLYFDNIYILATDFGIKTNYVDNGINNKSSSTGSLNFNNISFQALKGNMMFSHNGHWDIYFNNGSHWDATYIGEVNNNGIVYLNNIKWIIYKANTSGSDDKGNYDIIHNVKVYDKKSKVLFNYSKLSSGIDFISDNYDSHEGTSVPKIIPYGKSLLFNHHLISRYYSGIVSKVNKYIKTNRCHFLTTKGDFNVNLISNFGLNRNYTAYGINRSPIEIYNFSKYLYSVVDFGNKHSEVISKNKDISTTDNNSIIIIKIKPIFKNSTGDIVDYVTWKKESFNDIKFISCKSITRFEIYSTCYDIDKKELLITGKPQLRSHINKVFLIELFYNSNIEESYVNVKDDYDFDINIKSNDYPYDIDIEIIQEIFKKGTTAQRPTGVQIGFTYKDTDLNKWIIWNGEAWENIDGTALG